MEAGIKAMRGKSSFMMLRVCGLFGSRPSLARLERFFTLMGIAIVCCGVSIVALFAQTNVPTNASQRPSGQPPAAANQVRSDAAARPAFFVMIDAAHGGSDSGARFSDKLLEKDITLAIGRKLRGELQNRGITAVLLRDNDSNITYDQRAVITNAQRAGMYVAVHAGMPGVGVRVYTALMPADVKQQAKTSSSFLPWDIAQAEYLERSQILADTMIKEMNQAKIVAGSAAAPLKPLSNIAAPAIGIEVAPPSADAKPDSLTNPRYQQAIALAAANAISVARPRIEERRP